MIVVNLFAGPGAGKSTTAAGLFNLMKLSGHNVELVTEVAKDFTWQEHWKGLQNQLLILGQQDSRLQFLEGKVDYVITDSPLLLGLLYSSGRHKEDWFTEAAVGAFRSYENINFLIKRRKPYQPKGRNQTEDEAKVIDVRTEHLLMNINENFRTIPGDREAPHTIYNMLMASKDLEETIA